MTGNLGYRPCVGVMLVNAQGQVFVGQRLDNPGSDAWQMPQGGIDKGEEPEAAALRELREETGLAPDHVSIIARMDEPVRYDLPEDLVGRIWGGKYRGQEQEWFLARLTAGDDAIDIDADDTPEFSCWKWADPETLPELIVPFKRHVYRQVLEAFRELV
ncbi:RNA pyrophosphohydrolase [Parerythrobacter jejuensis]|uniref:RNA pyrophosphohydrolase n=1 Tax=Parerythrobacter jejuensis TaxID=795812 RepID=A0A845AT49_9SPHN|nr:RNA pyrophosphohydrolase [Parerythrobacter jejuensis]MXP32537.1 RNA pyrophosphohydrolase [Parerythrobacter jejuensis]